MKQIVLASTLTLLAFNSFASTVTIGCTDKNVSCAEKVQTVLNRMGCNPTSATSCFENTVENKAVTVCTTSTQRCENARTNIFYSFECRQGAQAVKLSQFDEGLSANLVTNIFGNFKSGFICIR